MPRNLTIYMKWTNFLKDTNELMQEILYNLSSSVSVKEREFLMKSFPRNKILVAAMLTCEVHRTSKEKITLVLYTSES